MSFEKVVKNACKPKPTPPKAKYLDPILAATWSEDGAVHDVCKALAPRFREPNAIVVFKALIVLHTMIRNGATDNVLSYLSSSEVLRLKNVSTSQWEGYLAPENLQNYATYLNARIRAYRELKHDAIHVQSENNRDTRLSMSLEEDARRNRNKNDSPSKGPARSKTISGRKLRVMTVEKGLLRETRIVQKMIDALVECRFYLDNLEDELAVTALRMLVKDLLILFQAGNEGVINVLEHYFEMSHVDAEQALSIYRHFCKQTEYVVEYLGVAKKLQNILNVPIPNLKHAPVSLVGALEEYLNDPNFEQNRIEYKTNKDAADKGITNGAGKSSGASTSKAPSPQPTATSSQPSTSADGAKPDAGKAMADFFSAIEEEQPTMFNPQTGSPTNQYFQQQAAHNPFVLRQQMTGAFPGPQPFAQPQMPMQTGFLQPQFTAMPNFPQQAPQFPQLPQQQTQHPSFSSFLQPQPTAFLQPQATGANPFRQSMMAPQATGMSPFGMGGFNPQQQQQLQPQPTMNANPFPMQASNSAPSSQPSFNLPNPTGAPAFNAFQANSQPASASPFAAQPTGIPNASIAPPARPASTPATNFALNGPGKSASPPPQPVKTHQTGSRNPFGVPVEKAPPVPKPPTLMELAMGGGFAAIQEQQRQQQQSPQMQPQPTGFNGFGTFTPSASTNTSQQSSAMSSIASSFSSNKPEDANKSPSSLTGLPSFTGMGSPLMSQNTSTTVTSGTFSDSIFSSLGSQQTGATSVSNGTGTSSFTPSALQPQATGFTAGIKAFKPTSSFGASLMESLPPIPGSAPTTPGTAQPTSPPLNGSVGSGLSGLNSSSTITSGLSSQPTGAGGLSAFGSGSGGLGSGPGVGLRPQMTGASPGANPFRATMFATGAGGGAFGGSPGGLGSFNSTSSLGTGSMMMGQPTGMNGFAGSSSMGTSLFGGGAFGQNQPNQQQQGQQHQQQGQTGSLI